MELIGSTVLVDHSAKYYGPYYYYRSNFRMPDRFIYMHVSVWAKLQNTRPPISISLNKNSETYLTSPKILTYIQEKQYLVA